MSRATGTSGPSNKRARKEPDFEVDREDVKAWLVMLKQRAITPTRWVDHQLLQNTGLAADLKWMAQAAGLADFVQIRAPTYERLTLDCLSSFHSNIYEVDEEQYCWFIVGGRTHRISLARMCEIFGFPNQGTKYLEDADVELAEMSGLWNEISILRNYDYLKKKMSLIQNPTIRYLAIVMANSLFARENAGAMAHHDMTTLVAALKPAQFNFGALLIQHLHRQQAQTKGNICCGGIFTHIATREGLQFDNSRPVRGSIFVDSSYLTYAGFLRVNHDNRLTPHFRLRFSTNRNDEVLVALPFPHGFALQGRDFQMTREQFQVACQEAGLEPQEPEDEGRWGEAAAGFAPPQQQDGWGDWN